MYTEFHFNVELRSDTPPNVLLILRAMVDADHDTLNSIAMPEHPFFACERWRWLFVMDSAYFAAKTRAELFEDYGNHFLCVRSNIKNYSSEIEKFVDWITPYLNHHEGDFLGFSRHESTETPTLIHASVKAGYEW